MNIKVNPSDPNSILKFVDQLKKPPVAIPVETSHESSYYEIEMKEANHSFHKYFPATSIWGYDGMYPGPTVEVLKDKTIYVKWINNLPLKHFLPIDHTLHGAIDTPEVRTVVHLHGANVAPDSDGYPEAWFTRNYTVTGSAFKRKVYKYTNHQPAAGLWYHDHSMGITRLNIYAGLAGFYFIRDLLEKRLQLPSGKYEIPLMIQDKSFNEDGSLFYPDSPPFPVKVKPSITPFFFGNTIVVNGKVWPHLKVEPRKYRFRLLNASNRRGYTFSLSNEQSFYQIGTDGGLLTNPVQLKSLSLLPAERSDIIIDFSNLQGQHITLMNSDANADTNTKVIMQFQVVLPLSRKDSSQIPEELYPPTQLHEHMAHTIRNLPLNATRDEYGRPMLLLGNRMWDDPTTEKPSLDSIEVWNLINLTPFPHPIHIHLVQFKIIERRPFNVDRYEKEGVLEFTGPGEPPKEYERGWKDVANAEIGMITKLIMHFKDHVGYYIWHCHFLEHEDHDMMRPIRIIDDSHPVEFKHGDPHPDDSAPDH